MQLIFQNLFFINAAMPTVENLTQCEVPVGKDAVFVTTVIAGGTPTPKIEWYLGEKRLKAGRKMLLEHDGRQHTLTVKNCCTGDNGIVKIRVESIAGTIEKKAQLIVEGNSQPSTI